MAATLKDIENQMLGRQQMEEHERKMARKKRQKPHRPVEETMNMVLGVKNPAPEPEKPDPTS